MDPPPSLENISGGTLEKISSVENNSGGILGNIYSVENNMGGTLENKSSGSLKKIATCPYSRRLYSVQ